MSPSSNFTFTFTTTSSFPSTAATAGVANTHATTEKAEKEKMQREFDARMKVAILKARLAREKARAEEEMNAVIAANPILSFHANIFSKGTTLSRSVLIGAAFKTWAEKLERDLGSFGPYQ